MNCSIVTRPSNIGLAEIYLKLPYYMRTSRNHHQHVDDSKKSINSKFLSNLIYPFLTLELLLQNIVWY